MPTSPQSMFEDRPAEFADGTKGNSNKKTLKKAFRFSIHHKEDPAVIKTSFKTAYVAHTMSGFNRGFCFEEGIDLDYGTLGETSLEKQPPKAIFDPTVIHEDNTIAPGGKGPTVATLNIESTTSPAEGRPLIDASMPSSPPFVSPPNSGLPYQSSEKIGASGLHGALSDAEASGDRGSSAAS